MHDKKKEYIIERKNMSTITDPIKILNLELKNRMVKSATAEAMSDTNGYITEKYCKFYERSAKGGVSAIISGNIFPSPDGRSAMSSPLLDDDEKIEQFKKLTDVVHSYDTKIFAQINHCGREALIPKAPSAVRNTLTLVKPKRLDDSEIKIIINNFANTGIRVKKAGFDGIQLHCAHGYLINQFLSGRTNKRKDIWGGKTVLKRMKFLEEIYGAIREKVGDDYPVMVKINGTDHISGGLSVDEVISILKRMEEIDLNAAEISGGSQEAGFYGMRGDIPIKELLVGRSLLLKLIGPFALNSIAKKTFFIEGFNLSEAKKIKKALNIPVICCGGMYTKKFIDNILKTDQVDMVSFGRPLINNPNLPKHFISGKKEKSGCIACNKCFIVYLRNVPLKCAKNIKDFNSI
jgi:2,4-dienoyl-CoA reductase-like NADH-dependent reductase (Old Yellow Enzyme family)